MPASSTRRPGRLALLLSAAVNAIAGYVVLLVAARSLTPSDNALFLAFWGAFFLVLGILIGVQSEATRAVAHTQERAVDARSPATSNPILVALHIAIPVAIVVAATGVFWMPFAWGDAWVQELAWITIGCLAVAVNTALIGSAFGRKRFRMAAALMSAETLFRLALVAVVAVLAPSISSFAGATALASLSACIAMAMWRSVRDVGATLIPISSAHLRSRYVYACVASGASSMLMAGFPLILRFCISDADYRESAPLMLAVTVTRAPLMVPMAAFLSAAIAYFVSSSSSGSRLAALWRALRPVLAVGGVSIPIMGLVGPQVMQIFGPAYELDGLLLMALTVAAIEIAILSLTGALALALDLHRAYTTGWLLAAGTTTALLLLPLPVEIRVVVSLMVGPLVGAAVHMSAVMRVAPSGRTQTRGL